MPRIRTIKPEFFLHDGLWECDERVAAEHGREYTGLTRLLFIGLWCVADREGRFAWRPRRIKAQVLPYDEVSVDAILEALIDGGFVVRYRVGDETYGAIPSFSEHQSVNQREADSRLPSPDDSEAVIDTSRACTCTHMHAHADTCTHMHARGEGKGKERKGKERKGRERKGKTGGASAPPRDADEQRHGELSQSAPVADDVPGPELARQGKRVLAAAVDRVIEHYRAHHPRASPGDKERRLIAARLKEGRTVRDLCQAIDGNHISPFHCGENESGKRYHRLDLIFRDAAHTDEFIELAQTPREPVLSHSTRRTMSAAQSYLERRKSGELEL